MRPEAVYIDTLPDVDDFVKHPMRFKVTPQMEAFEARVRELVRHIPPEHVEWMARWAI